MKLKAIAAAVLMAASITSSANDIDDLCRELGALASSTVKAKNKGVPLAKMLAVARNTSGPQEGKALAEATIKTMYESDLHPDDAEMITYMACKRQLGGGQ
jgi:hypothetical protein